jgi:hypothetical protein
MLSDITLSDLMTIYIFDDDEGEIVDDNPKYTKIEVKINKKKILNEINKTLLILLKNEVVSI